MKYPCLLLNTKKQEQNHAFNAATIRTAKNNFVWVRPIKQGMFFILILYLFDSCKIAKNERATNIYSAIDSITSQLKQIQIPEKEINIIIYSGHKPDETGSYDFKGDIQRAIDELASSGGGRLIFPHTKGANEWI